MKLDAAIECYLESLTPNTVRAYRRVWNDWGEACADLSSPTYDECHGYIQRLRIRGASDATIKHRHSVIRSVYSFLRELDLVRVNPMVAMGRAISARAHHQVRPTPTIASEAILRILSANTWVTREGIRDRALFALLFGAGLRRSEARMLNLEDVMTTPEGVPYVVIRTPKAGKIQQQPLPQWAYEYFSVLVSQRKSMGCKSTDPLFINYSRLAYPRLSDSSIYRIFKRRFGAGCHSARATYATKLKDLGYPYEDIANALRHSTTQQVKIYDKRDEFAKRAAARKVTY